MIRWFDAVAYLLVALGMFLSVLCVMKEFTAQDVRFFMRNLNPLKLGSYVKEELSNKDDEKK
jgi:hypothetical protein